MLTLQEYNQKYPKQFIWGSFANSSSPPHGVRFISEGMIQFTGESACILGGPFQGNYGQFNLTDYREATHPNVKYKGMKLLEAYAQADKEAIEKYNRSSDPKKKKPYLTSSEYPSLEKPFSFKIYGNDDSSYTKFYATEQEMMYEFELFVANEPLDMDELIREFDFIFTN